MPVIAIIGASDVVSDDQIAPTRRRTPGPDGGHVPTGLAGYTWDGAAYCPECAEDVYVTIGGLPDEGALEGVPVKEDDDGEPAVPLSHYPAYDASGNPMTDPNGFGVGVISCTDETDYPGGSCFVCHRRLQTNVLVYDGGGAHPTPVVEVRDPDRVRDPVEAFVLETDGDDVRVILAEPFGSHGDAGTLSWIPRDDVVAEYRDQLD